LSHQQRHHVLLSVSVGVCKPLSTRQDGYSQLLPTTSNIEPAKFDRAESQQCRVKLCELTHVEVVEYQSWASSSATFKVAGPDVVSPELTPRERHHGVVMPAQQHTVGHSGCGPRAIGEFVDAGSADGLDTTCIEQAAVPGLTFMLP
jgi:hypothetical protein